MLGVPGCGKSLAAKAVAAQWRLPLLKLDPSNLYNKFIGESEQNFKRAMKAAERYTTPSAAHKLLERFLGVWETSTRITMPGFDARAEQGRGG